MGFIFDTFRFLDFIDILLAAILIFQVYKLVRGTVAVNIFYGIFLIYMVWLVVRALNMQLLGSILGQLIGLGLLALLIVFQQEVRRFLLVIGTRYFRKGMISFDTLFAFRKDHEEDWNFAPIVEACTNLSYSKTGALLVLAKKSELRAFAETGCAVDATISSELIESIFRKDGPLHDGGMILARNRISAARCVLPVTENPNIPPDLGLRHRAGVGMSESSDSFVIIVSEETGRIAYANQGRLVENVGTEELGRILPLIFVP
ncbi:MAG: TIGR00159 family protein [Bacteroidetes bacterium GWF2_49_14]|nr:MAG: TIGR00159 family protein [Bacteroidetes bacterium GWF2_49_14]HBB92416.1 TIGR00159 family protein [Bacteroidales bacterium]